MAAQTSHPLPSGATALVPFCSVSVDDVCLFSVRPGVPVEDALGYASSMLSVAIWLAMEAGHSSRNDVLDGLVHCIEASKAVVDAAFSGLVASQVAAGA